MKKLTLFLLAFILTASVFAQNSGRGFSYQAVARDANGAIRKNEPIEIRFSLLRDGSTGVGDWIEEHTVNTDIYGTFSVVIGTGMKDDNRTYANFSDLNFAYTYWLKTEIKEGGTYIVLSNQALLSVPYAENVGTPVGSIMPYMGTTAPPGWLMCDGTLYDRTVYARLFAVIGTSSGATSATNFRVPDLRGRFLRGVSGATGNDPDRNSRTAQNSGGATGNAVGSLQQDATALPNSNFTASGSTGPAGHHSHSFNYSMGNRIGGSSYGVAYQTVSGTLSHYYDNGVQLYPINTQTTSSTPDHSHSVSTTVNAGGDHETRPTNVYVNYIIKY